MGKFIAAGFLFFFSVLAGVQAFVVWRARNEAAQEFLESKKRAEDLIASNEALRIELDALVLPGNLEKELRARLNYKRPGEKVLIVIPEAATSIRQE